MQKALLRNQISRLCLLTMILFSVMFVHAQEFRGLILGRVTDPSGAVVPNATITAVGPQQKYTAKTNAAGDYTIPFVQPGSYKVSAEAPGFKKTTQENVTIGVSQKVSVAFALEVGAVSDSVTVQAEQVGVNTVDASGGTRIDSEKIQNLPLNGRQMYMLMSLTPGVRFTSTVAGQTGQSGTRGWDETNAYVINGVQGGYNQFTLNGAPITQQTSTSRGSWNISPNVDAVEEFNVMTNTYDAQYGRAGGGTINTVLKGGTNVIHGTAFDFWRNAVLDANSYNNNQAGVARPGHNQHQFGGTIGGPIRIPHLYNGKDKTFFFFSFEGWREVLPGGNLISVPAADLHPRADGSVDFSGYVQRNGLRGIYDPLTTRCTVAGQTLQNCTGSYTRDMFPGNILPANRISPAGLKILSLFPMPNKPGIDIDNYVTSAAGHYKYNQPIGRIDHNFSDATRMYGMFAWWSGNEFRNTGGIPGAGMNGDINNYRSTLTQVVDITHTFRPNLFLDIRSSFNRAWNVSNNGAVAAGIERLTAADLGLIMPDVSTTSRKNAPEVQFPDSNYANLIGNQTTPELYETYDLSPSISHVIGRHNLHYGAQMMLMHNIPCCGIGAANGNFSFNSGWTQQDPYTNRKDGADIASLLLGYPSEGYVDNNETVYESYKYFAGYIQDDWKIRHNVTLNLGLRWDVETSPTDRNNRLNAGFCMTCVSPLSNDPQFLANLAGFPNSKLPNGETIINPLVGGFRFSSKDLKPYDTQFNHWQPRIGISWGVNDKTVVRGGYGINTAFAIELGGSTTWTQQTAYNYSPDGGLTPSLGFANGNPYPNGVLPVQGSSLGLMTGVGSQQFFDQRNRKIPYVQQYSFGIQRELPAGIVLDVSYVGSYTKDLRVGTNFNVLTPEQFAKGHADPNYLNQQVANPFYGILDPASSLGANPTIQAKYLMAPFPQFAGLLYSYVEPAGHSNYNSLAVKAEKKMTGGGALINGLNFLASFTWSKAMQATSYLNNAAIDDNTANSGLRDKAPVYMLTSTDRPWDFAFSGVYGLPIGKNGLIGKDARGFLGQLINNWTMDYIFTYSGGTPTSLPNSYNFSCAQDGFKPSDQSWAHWLNNTTPGCYTSMDPYTARTIVTRTGSIRNPSVPQLSMAIAKKFKVKEGVDLQFKTEAFNLTNTPLFGAPSTSSPNRAIRRNENILEGQPGAYQGFGTISGMQQNLPRQLQISLKLIF